MDKEYKDPYSGYYHSDQYQYYDEDLEDIVNVKANKEYYEECVKLYSNVLDASGMNLKDPTTAYFTHINKLQRRHVDPPYAGKTYIFVTRPDLNFWELETGVRNVQSNSVFNYFSKTKIGRAVMPFLMFPNNMRTQYDGERTTRSFIGNDPIDKEFMTFTPFINLFSNFCTSTSGGKDIAMETMETEGDFYGNRLKYPKGADDSFTVGEITLEISDAYGSPLLHLINLWIMYIHLLTKGQVVSSGKYVKYRNLDFTCSIYIFMTEKDNTTLARWAKYTGCFPLNVPLSGIQHNIESNPDQLRNFSVSFAYNRYSSIEDPGVLADFNFLMEKFLTDTDAMNIQLMKDVGVAPKKMLDSKELKTAEYIQAHPSWYADRYKDENNNTVYKDVNYYDNKFWGTLPYIINHKLVWIDPNEFFKGA